MLYSVYKLSHICLCAWSFADNLYDEIAKIYKGYTVLPLEKSTFEQYGDLLKDKANNDMRENLCAIRVWCLNGGTCIPDKSKPQGYYCKCPRSVYGYNCQICMH